jgi:hypothetical protein
MTPKSPPSTLARMEAMLRRCRRRIVLAEIRKRLRTGLQTGSLGLLSIAAVFLLLHLLSWSLGTPTPGLAQILAVIGVFWALVFVLSLVSGILGAANHPSHAAERLDLSQATHNRIATAIALLRSGDESPFARAAILDGLEYLERLQSENPHVDVPPFSWRRAVLSLTAAVAMMLTGLFLVPKPGTAASDGTPNGIASSEPSLPTGSPVPEDDDKSAPRSAETTKTIPSERPTSKPPSTTAEANAKRPETASESRSMGSMASPASGESRSSQTASSSNSAASGSGAKSEPQNNEPSHAPKPREAKKQTASQPKPKPQDEKKGGSISARGSSGAGSMQTAQSESPNDVKAKSDDSDDFQNEEEPDEEMDPDKQRLGAQPALKNRSSKVSRELSLVTGLSLANKQNRGRGGPGGQKKSRGTATMIMGVPIPGFVRGRLLPGPTKSTQEEIEPSPVEGAYAAAAAQAQARPEEEPQERYHPAAANAIRARDFLIQSHTEHDNTLNRADADK